MKEKNMLKIAILILTIIFVALSFTPCRIVEDKYPHYNDYSKSDQGTSTLQDNSTPQSGIIQTDRYYPGFCSVVSCLELLLLVAFNRRWARKIGLLLNTLKTIGPFLRFKLEDLVNDMMSERSYATVLPGEFSGMDPTISHYSEIIYAIFVIGAFIFMFYVIMYRQTPPKQYDMAKSFSQKNEPVLPEDTDSGLQHELILTEQDSEDHEVVLSSQNLENTQQDSRFQK